MKLLLALHIAAGFLSLFVAPVALATRKGGKAHRQWGLVYVAGMTIVAITSLVMAATNGRVFLFMLAIFSHFLAFSGYRVLRRKRPDKGQTARLADWSYAIATVAACGVMVFLGLRMALAGSGAAPILLVFGVLGGTNAALEIRKFVRPPKDRNAWWFDHMGGMIGSYIAAVTAFSATNMEFLPLVVRWLWPTAIGAIGLSIWIRYYRNRFAARTAMRKQLPASVGEKIAA